MAVVGPKTDAAVAGGVETLNASLATIIKQATNGIDAGVSFLSDQIPDVVHQLLVWKLAENLFWGSASIIIAVIVYGLAYRIFTKGSMENKYDRCEYNMGVIFLGLGGLLPLLASLACIAEALKIWLAPKIYLIEYAASLIKGH